MYNNKRSKGSALVYVLVVIGAASVLFAGTIRFVVSHVRYDTTLEPDMQAFHAAEAGVYFYRWYLAHNVEGRTVSQIEDFWANDPLGVDDNGDGVCDDTEAYVAQYEGIGQYRLCVTPPEPFSTIVRVRSEGQAVSSGVVQSNVVHARFRKPSWSEFAVLANAAMRLSEGTVVYGPMHVNGGFRFDGVAHNVVSSSVSTYDDPDTWYFDSRPGVWTNWSSEYNQSLGEYVFQAGTEFPVVAQDFNSVTADFEVIRQSAVDMGLYFGPEEHGVFIELGKPDPHQMRVTRVNRYDHNTFNITRLKNHTEEVFDIPDIGTIYVRHNVWVEGIVPADKRLTIAANNPAHGQVARIFLGTDDIFYDDRESNSVLGLISEGNIEIIRDCDGDLGAPDGSDEETLNIDAVLLSQFGRVGRDLWSWDYKDTITIFGAIATNTRMGFGYVTGWPQGDVGFEHRNLVFDGKLLYYPPPLFPTGSSYVIDMWDASKS